MTKTQLQIAVYLRKSRADVEAEKEASERGVAFDTLTKHRNEMLSVAMRDQHQIIDVFEEVVSGEFIAERPEMQQLLQNVRNMKYDAVLVMDIDRLGRGDKIDQGRIERAFKDSQTLILTPSEVYDLNDESGEFNVEVRTFLSRFEYKKIKKRLQGGRIRSAREGRDIGRKPPYGYSKDRDKRLHINEEEAEVVRLIYQWSLDGKGRVQIANQLTQLCIPTPSGKNEWSHVTVRKILSNPKYKGDQVYGRVRWTKQEDGSYKTRQVKDPAQFVVAESAHAPIIDPQMWADVQAAISQRASAPVKKSTEMVNPFAGLLRCKKCGKMMLANNPSKRPNKYLYCTTPGCPQKMIVLARVEATVLQVLEEILQGLTIVPRLAHVPGREALGHFFEKQHTRIQSELEKACRQKDRLHDLLEEGIYDIDTFAERSMKLQNRIQELEQSLLHSGDVLPGTDQVNDHTARLPDARATALELYRSASSVRQQNQILRSLIKEIRYNRDPFWKDPFQFELEIDLYE